MCLTKVTKRAKANKKVVPAWKGFFHDTRGICFPFYYLRGNSMVLRGRWLKAESEPLSVNEDDVAYPSGFHATDRKGAANLWGTPFKVLLRDVRTQGIQQRFGNQHRTYVANEMYVPDVGEKIVGTKIVKKKGATK